MLLLLGFIIVVILVLLFIKSRLNTTINNLQKINSKKCKNELINNISPHTLVSNKYLIRNLDGKSIGYDLNNLDQDIFYVKQKKYLNIERIKDYYLIYTNSKPRLYLNTDINGKIKFKLNKNLKGNQWIFLKLNNDLILKKMLLNEINHNNAYKKYNFIYKNGFFIKSVHFSYYISDRKCDVCPNIENIFIISID